jgi:sugar lactone lactonase YvrE
MPRSPSSKLLSKEFTMLKHFVSLTSALALGLCAVTVSHAQSLNEAWRATGFVMPESASYDPGTNALYVSNINSPDMSANGQGYITQLGLDGTVMKEKFAEGLNAPKGTFVAGTTLYVAGVEEVVEIDLSSGQVTARHAIPGATFVNDVAVAEDGTIYATETMQGAIYTIANGTATQFVADPALAGANGIAIDGSRLLVATLGDISGGFQNLKPSNVKAVDIATKAITDFGSAAPVGTLDGIELIEGGVLVTDNGGGRLVKVAEDGMATEIGQTGAGSADFELVQDQNLVVIPLLNTSEVVGFTLTP